MSKTLDELAKIVKGEVVGDASVVICGLNGIKEAVEGELTFLANPLYAQAASSTSASAIVVAKDVDIADKNLIKVANPSEAFSEIAAVYLMDERAVQSGIHPSAHISKSAVVDKTASIGPNVVIEDDVHIGEGSVIRSNVVIGRKSKIGKNSYIYPNVTIYHKVTIQDNVIIHSGTVIGSDGFGYEQTSEGQKKIPQIGTVLIENDVEIGSNVSIDRARFDKTIIGAGTKIDNLVQIGHNVKIGKDCIIISQSGISGSTELKDSVIIAGQTGVAGHITIGENSIIASKSGVTKSVPPNSKYFGFPAKEYTLAMKNSAHLQRIHVYVERLKELEKRLNKLEDKN